MRRLQTAAEPNVRFNKMSQESKIKLNLEGEFSASDIESVIRTLAKARAGLKPQVPENPPTEYSTDEALVQAESKFSIATLANGGIRIWLRNEGIGWIAFDLGEADKRGIADFLSKKLGHTNTSH
jgi:translation initiation factor 2 beta subunit (eIF-2beta)/eIF-5